MLAGEANVRVEEYNVPAAADTFLESVDILEEGFDQLPSGFCGNRVLSARHQSVQFALLLGFADAPSDIISPLLHVVIIIGIV
mgnify:CR=1 FL=1